MADRPSHNHGRGEIKATGQCPACDADRLPEFGADRPVTDDIATIRDWLDRNVEALMAAVCVLLCVFGVPLYFLIRLVW